MLWFYDASDAIGQFMAAGGTVLDFIALLMFVMWMLIFERAFYYYRTHQKIADDAIEQWNARSDIKSWAAHAIREAIISRISIGIDYNLNIIKTLVSLAPLMGLLGTVTGMIEVFNILAITGGGDARSMASGVSKATIPTMAGMVAALSGVFASSWLSRKAQREKDLIQDHLNIEH